MSYTITLNGTPVAWKIITAYEAIRRLAELRRELGSKAKLQITVG